MAHNQPPIFAADGRRVFAGSAAAVLAFIIDSEERVLLLSHPDYPGGWEVISGALEAEETIVEGVLREIREEAGPAVRVRPLGTVHAGTFRYDSAIQYMISIGYLLAYEGGPIVPGDDMAGSAHRWWRMAELHQQRDLKLLVPQGQLWMIGRAIQLYRLWKDEPIPPGYIERIP